MKISETFPRKYATGEDIKQPVSLPIARVVMEQMHPQPGSPAENKPVIYFEGANRGIILNRTLALQIAAIHGDETAAWTGKKIQLYTEKMRVAGQDRIAIRARPAPNGTDQPPAALQDHDEE